jgi:putative DeoR family transcriptional regulator (stage III sporulation protein D)
MSRSVKKGPFVSERLLKINPVLANQVRIILDENKADRHIRGGMATKLKYEHNREKKEAI